MTVDRVAILIETTRLKSFASALDWPGWSRAGKTPEQALETLLGYASRYGAVVATTGISLPTGELEPLVVATDEGDASTAFGVPSRIADLDRAPLDATEAARRTAIVEAAWSWFDAIAASAPAELRKGPRGGGRDTAKIVEHVVGAEHAYAAQLGLRVPPPDPGDPRSARALREAMAEVLRRPSDGAPIAKRWTARYAHRRIAWHVLDHAWEIEDRSNRG